MLHASVLAGLIFIYWFSVANFNQKCHTSKTVSEWYQFLIISRMEITELFTVKYIVAHTVTAIN